MYGKAREVDSLYRQVRDSGGVRGVVADAVETAATDFKTYAWSAVVPDSAGTDFVLASAALSKLGAPGGMAGVADAGIAALNVRYLEPVTKALEGELETIQEKGTGLMETAATVRSVGNVARQLKGADPAMIGTTLLSSAVRVSKGVMTLFGKEKVASEYEKYVAEMKVPVRVKELLESTTAEDRQSLLLFWALATSAHKASDRIGTGVLTDAELCGSDSWTAAQCSSAKTMILAAARAVGYTN
jgi:hypothetical protein